MATISGLAHDLGLSAIGDTEVTIPGAILPGELCG
jgi:hypothetical protein